MAQWLPKNPVEVEFIDKLRADIRELVASLKCIVELALSSDSGREIRRRFWPQEGMKGGSLPPILDCALLGEK
jgi:hypothetical protein